MHRLFDQNAPKERPTILSVNSDILAKSLALKINLSATLEHVLERQLAEVEAKKIKSALDFAILAFNGRDNKTCGLNGGYRIP